MQKQNTTQHWVQNKANRQNKRQKNKKHKKHKKLRFSAKHKLSLMNTNLTNSAGGLLGE
jgi:hypothetical protein